MGVGQFLEFFKAMAPARLAAIAGVVVTILGLFAYLGNSFSKPELALLYSELDSKDAGQIVSKLEASGVSFELKDNGAQIFVPKDQVARLRVSMAEEGIPMGGSIGYEIFDRSEGFGTTSMVQDINLVRALEGELARSIRAIESVKSAKVHLVIPRRQLFSREFQNPSASILLRMRGKKRLEPSQVQAIQHLVAAAVPGLSPKQISIVDDRGTLLARGGEGETTVSSGIGSAEEAKITQETRLARAVETLLEKTVGPGKVRAEVAVEMDFDRMTENSETYDPNSQVVRSTQTSEERNESSEHESQQNTVSASNYLPGENKKSEGGPKQANKNSKIDETVNYEISRTVVTHIKEGGDVKRLSVAVMVDGSYVTDSKGATTYTPRSKDEMDNLTRLVKSAVGFKEDRGDTIDVVNLQFAQLDSDGSSMVGEAALSGMTSGEILKLVETLSLAALGLGLAFFIVRPILTQSATKASGMIRATATAAAGTAAAQAQAGAAGSAAIQQRPVLAPPSQEDMEAITSLARNKGGRVFPELSDRASNAINKNPEAALEVFRVWMYRNTNS